MKSQNLLPGICLALLLISVACLFFANLQKGKAIAQLHDAQQRVADLQSRLDQLNNSSDSAQSDEISRLRAEERADLPRLRRQVEQLQAENKKLMQQLADAGDASKRQQAQMQELEAENQEAADAAQAAQAQADAAQAQAQAVRQTAAAHRSTCIANLRLIYAAKQAWALEKGKTDTDIPTEQDLLPYLKGGVFPVCPSGGAYTIGAVGQLPTCSIPGHVLPPQ